MSFEGKILCSINDQLVTALFVNNTYNGTEHHSDFVRCFVSVKYYILLFYSERNRMNTFQHTHLTFQQEFIMKFFKCPDYF